MMSKCIPFNPDSIFLGSALKRKSARLAKAVERPKERSMLFMSGFPTIGLNAARSMITLNNPIPVMATRIEMKKGIPNNDVLKKPIKAPIM